MLRITLITILCCAPALADLQVVGAVWTPFPSALCTHIRAPDTCRTAYFDSYSWKGPNSNIGYVILGLAGAQPYLSSLNFYFTSTAGASITLMNARGAWSPGNSLGWYAPDFSDMGWILHANGQSPQLPVTVHVHADSFGLFFVPDQPDPPPGAPAYYTDSYLNQLAAEDIAYAASQHIPLQSEAGLRHFAVFSDGGDGFYMGIEDRSVQIGDADYADLILHITPIPEPAPLLLLLIAVLLIGKSLGVVRGWARS